MGILIVLFIVGFIFLVIPLMPRSKANPFTKIIKDKKRKGINPNESGFIKDYSGSQQYQAYKKSSNNIGERIRSERQKKSKKPEIKEGKRGGTYTEDVTKDGRPYRRYF
tara:strand:+ start:50 stop:376 length:327 start_codon:yes stop_codon:yes gene_type:complete